ncbi:hypothetical protein BpHYR1_016918, partial [Brachionus plicatilis]
YSLNSDSLNRELTVLCNTVKKQKAEIDDLKKTVEDLKQKQGNDNEKSGMSWSELVGGGKIREESRMIRASVTKVVSEIREIENNVVFSGICEEGEEEDKTKRRISWKKKDTDNSGKTIDIIIVEFKDLTGKQTAMKNVRNLRDSSFKHVFINPDKTSDERELEYKLRKERNESNDKLPEGEGRHRYGTKNGRKFYWGISFNKLKEIYIESGDFNHPDTKWTDLGATFGTKKGHKSSIEMVNCLLGYELFQLVNQPTFGNNVLDLIISNDPSRVYQIFHGPPISSSKTNRLHCTLNWDYQLKSRNHSLDSSVESERLTCVIASLGSIKKVCKDIKIAVIIARLNFESNHASRCKKEPKLLYSYINNQKICKESIRMMKDPNGMITTATESIVNILNDQFCMVFSTQSEPIRDDSRSRHYNIRV